MKKQLKKWKEKFGKKYTQRSKFDWKIRTGPFKKMVSDLNIEDVLEVGCNRGYNLMSLNEVLGKEAKLLGVEPNKHAIRLARNSKPNFGAIEGNAYDLPFKNGYFDLCLTCTLLIHIPPDGLSAAMREIRRVCNSYILSIEYYSENEEEVIYRGNEDMLWKRDYLDLWKEEFPNLSLVRKGYWGPEDGFDRCHWWLMETKPT
jgi:pseudaminic acid biosynthesis-associated methylase